MKGKKRGKTHQALADDDVYESICWKEDKRGMKRAPKNWLRKCSESPHGASMLDKALLAFACFNLESNHVHMI